MPRRLRRLQRYTDAINRMLAILESPDDRHPSRSTTPAWKAPAAAARL
jgi:hypothetical protein